MPPKSKKVSDKDLFWHVLREVDPDKLTANHVEYVYKLVNALSISEIQQTERETEQIQKTNGKCYNERSLRCRSLPSSSPTAKASHPEPGLSNNIDNHNDNDHGGTLGGGTAKEKIQSESQSGHSKCRKNCFGDPFCLKSLGFEKWASGDMDYDWPSDDEEDNDCLIKRKKEIPVGLVNLGATCYVNAFLQLWYHNLAFRNAVFEWRPTQEEGFPICDSLQYIFGLLELSQRSCVDPSSLIEILGLDASQQQDAQEFSKLFVDLLPCPQVKRMFSGSYDYVTSCSTCKHESRTASEFSELDLSIEGLNTLDECMNSFLEVEKLTGDNQYFCSKCQCKQNATRRIQLRKLPPVLNIQLLRFVFDRKTGHKKKLNTCLQFPDQLDLTSLISGDGEQHQYELTAVLMHSGVTAFSGHYTAHIRKLDHWFSFNDANVSKLKGKKLNLANEESLDLIPDVATASNDSRKKGNRSKNAYMLVYQKKSFIQETKDLQPSPVPENIQNRVEDDNSKMSLNGHEAEMRQTEQMVRVEMKKEQIGELWEGIQAEPDVSENFHFVPTAWIANALASWSDISPIDTRPLLCRHNKLNWLLHNKYKVVSQVKGEYIYKTYSDENTVVLNRRDSLCYECVKNQLIWRKLKYETEEDNVRITSLMSGSAGSGRYWVSKSELKKWRSLVLRPLELAAQTTEKANKTSHSNKGAAEDNTKEGPGDPDTSVASTGAAGESICSNGYSSSSNSVNGDTMSTNGETPVMFNSGIRCDHGNMDTAEKYRQLVPQPVWDILLKYFPDAVTFTDTHTMCQQCLGADEEMGAIEERRKAMVREEKQILSDLSALRNRPIIDSLTTDTAYCLTVSSFNQWKQFLRNPSSGMESIANDSVICPHNMICVHPSDENSVVLLWPFEWDVLSTHFPYDVVIEVKAKKPANSRESSYYTIPDTCSDCMESRLISEELESHNFTNSRIYIRLLDDDKKGTGSKTPTTDEPPGTNTDDDEQLAPDTKKIKVDPLLLIGQSQSSESMAMRRSGRRKHIRGDKQIRTSSNTSLKQLKVQLVKLFAIAPFDQELTLDGRKLEGDDRSLAELKLYPDCLLRLKGVIYDECNMEQALVQQGLLEEGFRGTGLVANNINTSHDNFPN